MSEIIRLNVSSVRNIQSTDIKPSAAVNVFFGENGSGKTSLLEAIHLLASGKSFRSSKVDPLINYEADSSVVYAELHNGYRVGLSKSRRQKHELHLQGQPQSNWENVARELPLQLLDSNSFLLLEGGPRSRRKYLDWGAFHVEHSFIENWRRSRKCLANRNFLLRQKRVDIKQLAAWDAELCDAAGEVDRSRHSYFSALAPRFAEVYSELNGSESNKLSIHYLRGWDSDKTLAEVLASSVSPDSRYGATQSGPHRAELDIRVGRNRAVEVLSRGQQKVLVSALKIAQGDLLSKQRDRKCIYLIDDLPAELDLRNRASVVSQLIRQGGQLFFTSVEQKALNSSFPDAVEVAMFHVERGIVTA